MHFGQTISFSCKRALTYAESLLVGVQADQFGRFAAPGGQVIQSNHPSFILGHLSIYGPQICKDLGKPANSLELSDDYKSVYSHTAKCIDDPNGDVYPAMGLVVEKFFESYRLAIECLNAADNSAFDVPNSNPNSVARFPTIAAMHAFYVGGHMMLHLGQLSAWRRATGMPAA